MGRKKVSENQTELSLPRVEGPKETPQIREGKGWKQDGDWFEVDVTKQPLGMDLGFTNRVVRCPKCGKNARGPKKLDPTVPYQKYAHLLEMGSDGKVKKRNCCTIYYSRGERYGCD